MLFKRIAIILVIGCCMAGVENLATTFDLEPGEAGYESYGTLGSIFFFLALPMALLKLGVIALIFKGDPTRFSHFFGESTFGFIWLGDIATIFFWAGVFYGLRWVFKSVRQAFQLKPSSK